MSKLRRADIAELERLMRIKDPRQRDLRVARFEMRLVAEGKLEQ